MPPLDHTQLFAALPDACVVLDTDLVMVDANPAYLALVDRARAELVGRRIEEVFPATAEDPGATERVLTGYRRALSTRAPHPMGTVRYDFPAADGTPGSVQRWFSVTIAPVLDDAGVVTHLVGRAREITDVHAEVTRALRGYRVAVPRELEALAELADLADTSLTTGTLASALATELEQMHEAMATRATIEQAKGMVMAERRCSPDDAFAVLRQTSQHANRKLRDVALEMVAGASRPTPVPGPRR